MEHTQEVTCHPWVREGDTGSLLRQAERPLLPEAPTVVPLGKGLKPQCLQVAGGNHTFGQLSLWAAWDRGRDAYQSIGEEVLSSWARPVPREVT